MMRLTLAAMLALATLVAPLPASATEIQMAELACPLGPGFVKVYTKLSANTHGGFDSDLASYSTQGQFREFAVATCSENLFSLLGSDMADPAVQARLRDSALATQVHAVLDQAVASLPTNRDPEVWERYGIAAKVYQALGKDDLFLADLYLQASWTARDAAVGVYIGLNGPAAVKTTLAQGESELAKDLTSAQRKTLLYNMARVAHRGGLGEARDRYLDAFVAVGAMTDKESAAVDTLRRIAHDVEPHYQDLAIEHYVAGLRREGLDMDTKIRATYVLADLLRRRGKTQEALGLYGLVLAEDQAPMNLREMALTLSRYLVGDE